MRQLRPALGESEARRLWDGARDGLVASLLRRLAPPHPPLKTELVWAPAYLVTIALDLRGVRSQVVCSVDALRGAFAIFDMPGLLEDAPPGAPFFPPPLDAAAAAALAREALVTTILRRRGRAGKPTPRETLSIELLRWPHWVFYHRRRRSGIDISVIDAATGARAGHKIKLGLLDAFRAAATSEGK